MEMEPSACKNTSHFWTDNRKVIYHREHIHLFGGEKKGVRPISGKHRDEQFKLYSELSYYDGAGIQLWLDGVPSTPEEIAQGMLRQRRKQLHAGLHQKRF